MFHSFIGQIEQKNSDKLKQLPELIKLQQNFIKAKNFEVKEWKMSTAIVIRLIKSGDEFVRFCFSLRFNSIQLPFKKTLQLKLSTNPTNG